MLDAFIYMFVLGSGASLGVAVVAYVSWKFVIRSLTKKKKGMAKRHGIIK